MNNLDPLTELKNIIKTLCEKVGGIITYNGWNKPNKAFFEYKFDRNAKPQIRGRKMVDFRLDTDEYYSQIVVMSQNELQVKPLTYSDEVTINPQHIKGLTRNIIRKSVFHNNIWYNDNIATEEIKYFLDYVKIDDLKTELIGLIENFRIDDDFELHDKIFIETPNDEEILKYLTAYPYDITDLGNQFVEESVNHVVRINISQLRGSDRTGVGSSSWAHRMLNQLETALYLFKKGDTRIDRTIMKSLYWCPGSGISAGRGARKRPLREQYHLKADEINEFCLFYNKLNNIYQNKVFNLFIRRFRKGLANNLEDKIIDYSICFESLFPDINFELKYRLSQYVALLIEDGYSERIEVNNRIKKFYDIRSQIVHGNQPRNISALIDIKKIENDLRKLIKIFMITGGGSNFEEYRKARIFGKDTSIDLNNYTYEIIDQDN